MPRLLALLVSLIPFLASAPVRANVFDASVGGSVMGVSHGGDDLGRQIEGPAVGLGLGFPLRPDLMIFGRLSATTGIEDYQHAHDQGLVSCNLRFLFGRAWVEGGLGVAFYRGRYRYADYFSGDAEYDDEIATPTLSLGTGVRMYRAESFDLNAHVNLALSPLGSEVSVVVAQLLVGPSWTYE